jgi:hypothetical protein
VVDRVLDGQVVLERVKRHLWGPAGVGHPVPR